MLTRCRSYPGAWATRDDANTCVVRDDSRAARDDTRSIRAVRDDPWETEDDIRATGVNILVTRDDVRVIIEI
jgi:hypothetical protein